MGAVQQLAMDLGADDRTLRRAIREGAVRCRRPSPRRLELSAGEHEYLRERWSSLSEARAVLRTEPNVRFAALFGSMARGDDHKRSDADVVVQMAKRDRRGWLRLQRKLEAALGRPVQLVHYEDVEASPLVLAEVLRDGRPLVDRTGYWPRLQRTRHRALAAARQAQAEMLAGERDAISYFRRQAG